LLSSLETLQIELTFSKKKKVNYHEERRHKLAAQSTRLE